MKQWVNMGFQKEYLIAHPDKAQEYSKLKEKLANKYTYDVENYSNSKSDFIKEIDRKAKLEKNN